MSHPITEDSLRYCLSTECSDSFQKINDDRIRTFFDKQHAYTWPNPLYKTTSSNNPVTENIDATKNLTHNLFLFQISNTKAT